MPTTDPDIVQYASVPAPAPTTAAELFDPGEHPVKCGQIRVRRPTTAAELLALVELFGPTVEDGALVFDRDPPADLLAALRVLHTGIRAALTGRKWYGCGSTRKTAAPRPLDPSDLIPPGITLLCVEGDQRWDRIHPAARLDLPRLFAPEDR
ncbi:hypothetical protein [Frigoriglobus tundricola]|uniref:Uncharacterized protein n=1 Tax=Frigoriglobus tundricola TaxID=2774151 RepID=A0A6M5Z454_9BACT|nr:hypothetical protein [Frigoriglobus tundricola]QJX00254.1 hypothetical protein FTUN_7878 [Frigoriglobus tundricola]